MFKKILIANRGEIAVRIIRACKEWGISTVAVHSDVDRESMHVRLADESICIGSHQPINSYLNIPAIMSAIELTNSEAVHPGYGFLSENSNFAKILEDNKIKFIGPSSKLIKMMGDKIQAKKIAKEYGLPVIEGSDGGVSDFNNAKEICKKIGFPVLIKASGGGGGKGMRIVDDAKDLKESIASAEREAEGGFGDKRVFLERYIERSRHIEVQILGDSHGNLVHLGERECSIQRRHQKIIEESPSPMVSDSMRREMGEAALKLASKLKYESAGTVEFLVDEKTKEFWFLEVNTRLQVEHPVTEEVTGIDLVKEQLRIADGEELGFDQSDVDWFGSSIEVRLYAEDPGNDFLPVTGKLIRFEPANNPLVRWDVGIETGSIITSDFDPMLAKVISYGETRIEAANKLVLALKNSHFGGMKTNREFLISILESKEFLKGATTTDFIKKVKLNNELGLSEDEINDYAKLAAHWIQGKNRNEASV